MAKWISFSTIGVDHDPASVAQYHSKTRDIETIENHKNEANYILSDVTQDVDMFLDEYLRVNAHHCE